MLCLLEAYVYIFFQHWNKTLEDSDNSPFFMSCFFLACSLRKFCCLKQCMCKRGFVADCHKFFYFIIILAWAKLMVLYFKLQDKQPCNGKYLNKKDDRLHFCCNSFKAIEKLFGKQPQILTTACNQLLLQCHKLLFHGKLFGKRCFTDKFLTSLYVLVYLM